MKKSNLATGIAYFFVGILLIIAALLIESRLDSLLIGFAGAAIGPGLVMIYRYFYWTRPENRERYQERLANERIELQDELKVKLRDKSGRCAYVLGLNVIGFSMVVFCVLGLLEIIADSRLIILYLGGYLVFQIIAGIVIFQHLLRKY